MRERRNFVVVIVLGAALIWAFVAWFVMGSSVVEATSGLWAQRWVSLGLALVLGAWLGWSMFFEDRLPDKLAEVAGPVYYEADGLCFMPVVRVDRKGRAELAVYYQNRFENPACAIVHLRPPEDSILIREGMRDAHFAFRADGGDFGVIHQPIAIPEHLQGEVVNVALAAASYFPRGQGSRVRSSKGMRCGTMNVDWAGAAFKTGVHEVSGEIELVGPATLHLCMPTGVDTAVDSASHWRQERLMEGAV